MREGFTLRESSEVSVEQKRDADGDQHGAQKERKSYAEEKADGMFAFGGWDGGGERPEWLTFSWRRRIERKTLM